ncbi:MAG TPA: carboxyltransferase domain-containing protein [Acidimicrobiales bacterium]|nr:carboxyltransferase domain-containing protein [Acidimicrobiales bacterium]
MRARPVLRPTTPMGESAGLVFTTGWEEAQALARALRRQPLDGLEDVVPAADSVGLLLHPEVAEVAGVLERAARLQADDRPHEPTRHEVAVCFDGPDRLAVADRLGLTVEAVVALLCEKPLRVGWLGFMPGFPYLVDLPGRLASLPRLSQPRTRVRPGAFALAGGYAGIYPAASPGGWNVLGRTATPLFDAGRPEPATFSPGDLLQLRSVESLPVEPEAGGQERRPVTACGPRRLRVLDAGSLTLVQDAGRLGVAHLGVPRAGPADPLRHLVANIAVGNPETTAALEITMSGPRLLFLCDAYVALVGDCSLQIDGREMPASTVQLVEGGQTVSIGGTRRSVRAYLGVSGGIAVPPVLGSRSADATSGLWPGPLRVGDELDLGRGGRARGRWFEQPPRPALLEVDAGPDGAGDGSGPSALAALLTTDWEVAVESDRVGTRLRPLDPEAGGQMPPGSIPPPIASRATVTGAVQLPPDGCPVVLGPDHGTVGGYPVVAVVRRTSMRESGQLRPGDRVRFVEATTRAADPLGAQAQRAVTGWMSTELEGPP